MSPVPFYLIAASCVAQSEAKVQKLLELLKAYNFTEIIK